MTQEELYNYYESYLKGNLSGLDRDNFEKLIEEDVGIRLEFEKYKSAVEVLNINADAALDRELDKLRHQIPFNESSPERSGVNKTYFYAVAACLAVLLISGPYYYALNNYSNDSILKNELIPYANGQSRSASVAEGEEAMNSFENADYSETVRILTSIDEEQLSVKQQFILANALMMIGDYKMSAYHFKVVSDVNDVRYDEAAEWYYSIALLKDGQSDAGFNQLKAMSSNSEHPYSVRADLLLQKFESPWRALPGID